MPDVAELLRAGGTAFSSRAVIHPFNFCPYLRTSQARRSQKLASRFGRWHHACGGGRDPTVAEARGWRLERDALRAWAKPPLLLVVACH